jgi:hypothetical protein
MPISRSDHSQFMELPFLVVALPDGEPVSTSPGNAPNEKPGLRRAFRCPHQQL